MSDEEDYEFDYSDNEQDDQHEDDVGVEIENKYHESKQLREQSLEGARYGFKAVLSLEAANKGKTGVEIWGYKATKQLLKLAFRMNQLDEMMSYYVDLLKRINIGQVTRNKAEKNINGILDLISTSQTDSFTSTSSTADSSSTSSTSSSSSSSSTSTALAQFYQTTLEALKGSGNERMAFKTNSKLARLYVDAKDWTNLRPLLLSMHSSLLEEQSSSTMASPSKTMTSSSSSSSSLLSAGSGTRGTHLVEVYALYIQMFTELKDLKRVTDYARKAEDLLSVAVPQPFILGIIKECIGKA